MTKTNRFMNLVGRLVAFAIDDEELSTFIRDFALSFDREPPTIDDMKAFIDSIDGIRWE